MAIGESKLEFAVGTSQFGVVSEGIPEGQLLAPAIAVGRHEMQVCGPAVIGNFDQESAERPLVEGRRDVVPILLCEDRSDLAGGVEILKGCLEVEYGFGG